MPASTLPNPRFSGSCSGWIMLRSRTSTGSMPRSAATMSMIRSIVNAACTWPTPRNGFIGVLLVMTTLAVASKFSTW